MRTSSIRFALGAILVGALLCPPFLKAQPFVYVNDNNSTFGANSATGFSVVAGPALALVTGSPFATTSTGFAAFPTPVQEVAGNIAGSNCLFVSDPLGISTFPTGDVAAFSIGAGGVLTLIGNYNDPSNTSGANKLIPLAIDRRIGFPYFFAAFTGENKIAFYKVGGNCQLFWASSTFAVGLSGTPVMSMAVSKAGPHVLVVTYGDGSIQSFKIGGGTLTPLAIFLSTGSGAQGGLPESVDVTRNGKYAVFGDRQPGFAEVEVAKILPGGALAPTVDYGGPALASGVNLGPGLNSRNIWLSPAAVAGKFYLYITNKSSGQVTTARISQVTGVVSPAGTCTGAYTNPTTLLPLAWSGAAGLHTITATGSGSALAVAEYGTPSSVALLKIQTPTGCTLEVPGSPFVDPFSSNGLASVDVFPSRPY
jgi:hypothetical protein